MWKIPKIKVKINAPPKGAMRIIAISRGNTIAIIDICHSSLFSFSTQFNIELYLYYAYLQVSILFTNHSIINELSKLII